MPALTRLRTWTWLVPGIFFAILAPRSSAHTRSTDVTWTKDIEPIVSARCATCHARFGSAEPALVSYADARASAQRIREEILEGRMPPWPAARGVGQFSNDRSLTPLEIELLTAWADGATPLGKIETAPSSVSSAPTRAEIAPHTRVFPAGHPSRGVETFEAASQLPATRWISAWAFRPGSAAVVERAVVSIVGGNQLGTWTSGEPVIHYPAGVGQRLPAQSTLTVEIHYRKSTAQDMPPSALDLYLGPRPQAELDHQVIGCQLRTFPVAIEALAVTPSAVSAGDSVEVVARRPDASVQPLVVIPQFDPGNRLTYRFLKPVLLPRGTSIDVRSSAEGCGAVLEFINRGPARAAGRRP